jgi:hypothetical protein
MQISFWLLLLALTSLLLAAEGFTLLEKYFFADFDVSLV